MASNAYVQSVATPYLTVYLIGTNLHILSTATVIKKKVVTGYEYNFYSCGIQVTTPGGIVNIPQTSGGSGEGDIILEEAGSYRINYYGEILKKDVVNGIPLGTKDYSISFYFAVVENQLPLKPITITDTLNRLFDLCEPLRQSELPRFRLNPAQAAQFLWQKNHFCA